MRITNFSLPAILCMSLFLPPAMAEQLSVPDKAHRQGMSYEEYSKYREKMRTQMESRKHEDFKPKQAPSNSPSGQIEQSQGGSAYGKGYHSRNPPEDRPHVDAVRPDRPHGERFNRGGMGRR
ncbi:MAG TPA: hypothetical protein VMV48_09380 [Gallionellaceae bacterium]|nr:hypothetical protein [Gallionellaceae bacterium]